MQCHSCKQETASIKINNKLFCTNCGERLGIEVLPAEAANNSSQTNSMDQKFHDPVPKIIPAEDSVNYEKIIDDEVREINILEAEEELLDVIKELPQPKQKEEPKELQSEEKKEKLEKLKAKKEKAPIIKHNRKRAGGYTIVPGEPNLIKEPELPIPHDDMIDVSHEPIVSADNSPVEVNLATPENDKEENYPLALKEETETIKEKKIIRNAALRGFFKSGVVEVSKKKKRIKKKPMKLSKILWITIPVVAAFLLAGLVAYVNIYGNNPVNSIRKSESKVAFEYKKPAYLPPGYEASYITRGESNYITYLYWYTPNKKKTITLDISSGEWTDTKLQTEVIANTKEQFAQKSIRETKVWLLGEYAIYFAKDNVLYQISASDTISSEELLKIAEGMI